MMRRIHYWANYVWCDSDELESMGHMSDDFGCFEVSWGASDEDIERIVKDAADGIRNENHMGTNRVRLAAQND